ncbi:MAG TPA: hypothetical protein VGJ87_11710 [Roseiflexaceae bacterium]|jgi:hypothetical protein
MRWRDVSHPRFWRAGDSGVSHELQWRGEPGTRAPHVVLERSGKRISTLDLFGRQFVLLLGADGSAWQAAARQAADRLKVPLDIQRIGSEIVDINGSFGSAYGVSATGAVLVRPDGFVGWRAQAVGVEPECTIERTLARLLSH